MSSATATTDDIDDSAFTKTCAEHNADAGGELPAVIFTCPLACGYYKDSDTVGDDINWRESSYRGLSPDSMCFQLRTSLYECIEPLTCDQAITAFEPGNPCESEWAALSPFFEECYAHN